MPQGPGTLSKRACLQWEGWEGTGSGTWRIWNLTRIAPDNPTPHSLWANDTAGRALGSLKQGTDTTNVCGVDVHTPFATDTAWQCYKPPESGWG
jgi:hypothetical protein